MCKKLIYLISFVLLLSLADDVQAVRLNWTDAGADHLWSNPANWDVNRLPTCDDGVDINLLRGPTVANEGAVAKEVRIAPSSNQSGALTVDGGTLTTTCINSANASGSNATLNMKSGAITVSGWFYVAIKGTATLNMTGGTIAASNYRLGA